MCLFVSYFEVGGGTNFVTFSSAFTHVTFMNVSTDTVSLVFVFHVHVCTCSEWRDQQLPISDAPQHPGWKDLQRPYAVSHISMGDCRLRE